MARAGLDNCSPPLDADSTYVVPSICMRMMSTRRNKSYSARVESLTVNEPVLGWCKLFSSCCFIPHVGTLASSRLIHSFPCMSGILNYR